MKKQRGISNLDTMGLVVLSTIGLAGLLNNLAFYWQQTHQAEVQTNVYKLERLVNQFAAKHKHVPKDLAELAASDTQINNQLNSTANPIHPQQAAYTAETTDNTPGSVSYLAQGQTYQIVGHTHTGKISRQGKARLVSP